MGTPSYSLDIIAENIFINSKEWDESCFRVNICFKIIQLRTDDTFHNGRRITVESDLNQFKEDLKNEVTHIGIMGKRIGEEHFEEIGEFDFKWPDSVLDKLQSKDFAPQKEIIKQPLLNEDKQVGEVTLKIHVANTTDIDPDDLYFVIEGKDKECEGKFPTYCCKSHCPNKDVKRSKSQDIFLNPCGSSKCPFSSGFTGQFEHRNKRDKIIKSRHPFGPSFKFFKRSCPKKMRTGMDSSVCCECCQKCSKHKTDKLKKMERQFLCMHHESDNKFMCYSSHNDASSYNTEKSYSETAGPLPRLKICPRCRTKLISSNQGEVCPKCNLFIVFVKHKASKLFSKEDEAYGNIRPSMRYNLQGAPPGSRSYFPKCDSYKPCCCCAYHAYTHFKSKCCRPKKKSCYYYKCGDRYPGIVVGHKDCTVLSAQVPKHMGWLWNIDTLGIGQFRQGWRPGAIKKRIIEIMKYFLEPFPCDTLPVGHVSPDETPEPAKCKSLDRMDPVLRVRRHDGEYIISMNPVNLNAAALESEPLFFKIGPRAVCTCNNPIEECVCKTGKEQLLKTWQIENDPQPEKGDVAEEETQYNKNDYTPEDLNKVPRVSRGPKISTAKSNAKTVATKVLKKSKK